MAWTTVPTFTSGQILTAAQMNGLGTDLNELRGDYAKSEYTAGNLTLNSTSWANVSGPADLVLAADAGDVVEVSCSGFWNSDNVQAHLDVVTLVSGSPVNSFATGGSVATSGQGIVAWAGWANVQMSMGGNFFYKLVSGDISGGNVTLRLRYRTTSAANKTIVASTDVRFVFFARNHGPIEI